MFRSDPDRPKRRGLQRGLGRLTATIGVFALVIGFLTVGATTTDDAAVAATGSDFNPGNIISDALFYKSGTMDKNEIQSFLNSKVASCRSGYTCLKSYSQATASQSAKREGCAAYAGSKKESAASIIAKVSTACGINPQVLLVLLEKETGLISAKAPTSGTYRKATGYGCPDTSVCDSTYYGFFNQVYNAAYQFKKYQASPNSRGYVAGRWNTIQYHPKQSCGTSNVYIENQATAALYIYTPYRPNQASLDNMGRTGDGCSSYGNRNFWAFFTDWFGDTKGGSSFVRDAGTGAIYLIAGTVKHYVPSTSVYNALAKLGTYRNVSATYLSGYTTGTNASPLVRNPLTGDIALVQSNSRHRFTSCGQVSVWGYDCGATTDLMPGQWGKIPTGGEVSNYMVVSGKNTTYFLNSSTRFPVASWTGVVRLNGGKSPWVGTMGSSNAQRYPVGRTLETPGTAIKSASSNDVFLVDGTANRIRVPSMAVLGEYGASSVKTVPDATVNGYSRAGADLTLVANCNSKLVLVNSKKASPLGSGNGAGIATTNLASSTCSALSGGASVPGKVFAMVKGSPNAYRIVDGQARTVLAWSDVLAQNGGKTPNMVNWSSATINTFARPGGVVAVGSLIKSAGNPNVYLTDGLDRMHKLGSFGTTDSLGITGYRTVPDSVLKGYSTVSGSLSRVVVCKGAPYIALKGTLYKLKSAGGTGLAVTNLRDSTCAGLKVAKDGATDKVFIKVANKAPVYYLTGGKYREVTSWGQLVSLNGGSAPRIFTVNSSELWSMANGGKM
ncbi:hypothetical protein K2F54_07225 [Cryobacterium sp. 1639]|uniref:hypothetical protein n=1 Tax=Cryobacterium inferilacus TaxID=2866629 RepID=UPI001C738E54|nr:hypothetical protein [Cryobacterium sp. 1639]MBX0299766.1 hypothetical protein [Cryobacterium sp. 1639]